jgi:hypothetical protein
MEMAAEQSVRRRPRLLQQTRSLWSIIHSIKVSQDLLDHRRGFDCPHRRTAETF